MRPGARSRVPIYENVLFIRPETVGFLDLTTSKSFGACSKPLSRQSSPKCHRLTEHIGQTQELVLIEAIRGRRDGPNEEKEKRSLQPYANWKNQGHQYHVQFYNLSFISRKL